MDEPTPEQIAAMADLVADRSIQQEGCLSPVIEEFSRQIQAAQEFDLEVAYELNRISLAAWQDVDSGKDEESIPAIANALMFRAINCFGGAVTLARRGMDIEGQTLARAIYECAFWLGYLTAQPEMALHHFNIDNRKSILSHAMMLAKQGSVDPEIGQRAKAAYDEIAQVRVPGMEKMAGFADLSQIFPSYKYLCGTAAHSSVSSIKRLTEKTEDGLISHIFDFRGKRLPETLGFAIIGLLGALTKWQTHTDAPLDMIALERIEFEANEMFAKQALRDAEPD